MHATSSADAVIIMSGLLFIAEIIRLHDSKEKLSIKMSILLSILALFLLFSKFAYFPMLLLLLLLKDNFKKSDKKVKRLFVILLMLALIAVGSIYMYNLQLGKVNTQSKEVIKNDFYTPQKKYTKVEYIKEHPTKLLFIILNTFKTLFDSWVKQFLGIALGALTISTRDWIGYLFLIVLLLLTIDNMKQKKFNNSEKNIIRFMLVFNAIIIAAGLYLGWGPVRSKYLNGIQGRYFIPLFLIIPFLYNSRKLKLEIPNKELFITITMAIVHVFSIVYVLEYYLY